MTQARFRVTPLAAVEGLLNRAGATIMRASGGVEYVKLTFSGAPRDTARIIRDHAKELTRAAGRRVLPREVYEAMISALLSDMKAPDPPTIEATLRGGFRTTAWSRSDVVEAMRAFCDERRIAVSAFLATALRRYAAIHRLPLDF